MTAHLKKVLTEIPNSPEIICRGDLNARVGKQVKSKGCTNSISWKCWMVSVHKRSKIGNRLFSNKTTNWVKRTGCNSKQRIKVRFGPLLGDRKNIYTFGTQEPQWNLQEHRERIDRTTFPVDNLDEKKLSYFTPGD